MSDEDNFIARWSRLKREAADENKKPRAGTEAEERQMPDADAAEAAEAMGRPGRAPVKPGETEPAFDPATLPPIDSIVAGSDIRAFLQKGVPAELTKAALRRAWTTDPAIRDFIEVAENQWDFTDPTSIPGFGPLAGSRRRPPSWSRRRWASCRRRRRTALDARRRAPQESADATATSPKALQQMRRQTMRQPSVSAMQHAAVCVARWSGPDNRGTQGTVACCVAASRSPASRSGHIAASQATWKLRCRG